MLKLFYKILLESEFLIVACFFVTNEIKQDSIKIKKGHSK